MKIVKTLSNLKLILLVIIGLITAQIQAQKKQKKVKIYKAWVELNDHAKQKGFLYSVDNESINIISSSYHLKTGDGIINLKAKKIVKISLKRNGKGWRSTLYGFLGTTIVVELIAVSGNSDGEESYFPNEALAVGMGVLFGAPIGAIVGTGRMKFDIKGNEALFKSIGFEKYAFVKGDKN